MKRIVSIGLVLVMVLAFIVPIKANAEAAKEEKLFNKLVEYFTPYKDVDLSLIQEFVTDEIFVDLAYDLFFKEANDNLKEKLGDGIELKAQITTLFTSENIETILEEVKSGTGEDSLLIFKDFIENMETYFDEDWENINAELIGSAKDILGDLTTGIDENVLVKVTDIENHWAKDKIQDLVNKGIISGYPDGTFKPDNKINRAEFATMIVSALELELATYTEGFTDVKAGEWYADNVATMVSNGYVSGYPDGTFKANGEINRMEMAAILSNIVELELTEEEKATILAMFSDAENIQEWAIDAVAKVAKAEIMIGDNLGRFNPTATATRAEAATVIFNLIK